MPLLLAIPILLECLFHYRTNLATNYLKIKNHGAITSKERQSLSNGHWEISR